MIHFEKVRILFFELLPHKPCKAGFNLCLLFEDGKDFAFAHIQLKTALDKALNELNVE